MRRRNQGQRANAARKRERGRATSVEAQVKSPPPCGWHSVGQVALGVATDGSVDGDRPGVHRRSLFGGRRDNGQDVANMNFSSMSEGGTLQRERVTQNGTAVARKTMGRLSVVVPSPSPGLTSVVASSPGMMNARELSTPETAELERIDKSESLHLSDMLVYVAQVY